MDDPVPGTEGMPSGLELQTAAPFPAADFPQPFIQGIDAGIPFPAVRGQYLDLLHPVTVCTGAVQLHYKVSRSLRIFCRDKGEAFPIIQGSIVLLHPVCIGDDPAVLSLAEYRVKDCHRNHAALYQLPEHVARAYTGQLVDVSDQDQAAPFPDMAEKLIGQAHIGHGKFIRYDKACLQHAFHFCTVIITGKPKGTMHGHGFCVPCALRHSPACSSRRRCQKDVRPSQLLMDMEHDLLYGGLSCSRPSGDNGYQMGKCLPHRILLSGRQSEGKLPLGLLQKDIQSCRHRTFLC